MSETKHTPGEWVYYSGSRSVHALVPNGYRDTTAICVVCGPRKDTARADANALLIAAAPDLLAACKRTVEENLHLADGDVCTLIHLKRAIQKAEGGR